MKNDVLIVCNTHYQILVAIQLKLTIFRNRNVDCVLGDSISDVCTVIDRLKKIDVFANVFLAKIKGLEFKWYTDIFNENITEQSLCDSIKAGNYSEYLFANLGGYDLALGRYLMRNIRDIEVAMFEDGLSSYSNIYGSVIQSSSNIKGIKGLLKKHIIKNPFTAISSYYVFCPEIMVWSCSKVKCIPPVKDNIEELRRIANNLYDFPKLRDSYDEKVLFFEESYFQDGIDVDDISLVDTLTQEYSRSEIFIKTHPRNEINRFKELGYKTNIDKSIPWEVIALNIDLDEKVLVTMTSSAVVNTHIMRPSKAQMIYDFRGMDLTSNDRLRYTVEVIQKMKTIFPEFKIMEEYK